MIQTIRENGERYFVHYGDVVFNPEKFKPIGNIAYWEKPNGGLWASDVNAEYSWKTWIQNAKWCPSKYQYFEDYLDAYFHFILKKSSRILKLETNVDFESLPITYDKFNEWLKQRPLAEPFCNGWLDWWDSPFVKRFKFIDWIKIRSSGIDAVEFVISNCGQRYFKTWDVDSIVVLNPDVVLPM